MPWPPDGPLPGEEDEDYPLHVLGFGWDGFEPGLECRDLGTGEIRELDLERVDFRVGARKTCVGYYDDDGRHFPCPTSASVDRFSQCAACAEEFFIPDQSCIFDPKCDGNSEECTHPFCSREHVLYLAFYNTYVKIGMTSSRRVGRRLIEQGADAFTVFGPFPSRKAAREAEIALSSKLRIPQAFRQDMLLRSLSKPVDRQGIEGLYAGYKETLTSSERLCVGDLEWLDGYPIDLPLRQPPVLQPTAGLHRGGFLGVKGKWLVYESEGIRALSLSDLPARRICQA